MDILLINGSPRKDFNTAELLRNAVKGAESAGAVTETFHLYDLKYRGCLSCFACKQKLNAGRGHCAEQDELSPLLKKIMTCDALLLGSPVYYSDVTGMLRCFI